MCSSDLVDNLKIKHNRVLGYFIEVAARRAEGLMTAPLNESFMHRQTMANVVRFSTVELSDLERRIAESADKALALELELFQALSEGIMEQAEAIGRAGGAMAALDVGAANAEMAVTGRYCRPVVDDGQGFHVEGGRHPVVEAALAARNEGGFIANDCTLDNTADREARIWLRGGVWGRRGTRAAAGAAGPRGRAGEG